MRQTNRMIILEGALKKLPRCPYRQDLKLVCFEPSCEKASCSIWLTRTKNLCPGCGCDIDAEREVFSQDKLFTGHNCRGRWPKKTENSQQGEAHQSVATNWRPEGWEEIKRDACARRGGFFNQDIPIWIRDDLLLFEAGADAILNNLLSFIPKIKYEEETKDVKTQS